MTELCARLENRPHDPSDPDPWLALYLDPSLPLASEAKAALILCQESACRQYLLPLVRPLARGTIALLQLAKLFVPRWSASKLLHRSIHRGLRRWVRPEANWLILRHFHIGSEILAFISDNLPELKLPTAPLRPRTLADLEDHVFVRHDLNLYNFVIRLGRAIAERGAPLALPRREPAPRGLWNVIDVETAVELYTPIYQLFLSDREFWRASSSLQLDESIALLVSRMIGEPLPVQLVSNRHPLIPEPTLRAGHRLMLHALQAEALHGLLVLRKREQAKATPAT
jgi:hypothetical protein